MAELTDDLSELSEAFGKSLTLTASSFSAKYIETVIGYHVTKPGCKALIQKEKLLTATNNYYHKYDGPLATQPDAPNGVFFCITPTNTGELPTITVYPTFSPGGGYMDRLKMELAPILNRKDLAFFHKSDTSDVETSPSKIYRNKTNRQSLVVICLNEGSQYNFSRKHFIEFHPSECRPGDPLWLDGGVWKCQKMPVYTNICFLHSLTLADKITTWDQVYRIKRKKW